MFKEGSIYKILVDVFGQQTFLTVLIKSINDNYVTFIDKYGNELGYDIKFIIHHREIKMDTSDFEKGFGGSR